MARRAKKSTLPQIEKTYSRVPISTLLHHPKNPNSGDVGAIASSLEHLGAYKPIVVQKSTRHVLAGNHTMDAVSQTGNHEIDVCFVDVDDDTALEILLADNFIAGKAIRNEKIVLELLKEVGERRGNISGTGYSEQDFQDLIKAVDGASRQTDAIVDNRQVLDHEIPESQGAILLGKWQVEDGQVWEVGRHRLMCGDSKLRSDMIALLDGETVDMVATSPPYASQRSYGLAPFDWTELMKMVTNNIFEACPRGDMLINLGPSYQDGVADFYWNDWLADCKTKNRPLFGFYVWDKGYGMPGEWHGRLAPSHEFVFHFRTCKGSARKWLQTSGQTKVASSFPDRDGVTKKPSSPEKIGGTHRIPDSVIRISRAHTAGTLEREHTAVFPAEFAAFLVRTWSDEGATVLEPFSGSGTMIVACEQIGRSARAMEINPMYVALALERAERMGLACRKVQDAKRVLVASV